ncbi:MAG TPA: hypothetical protein VMZ91_05070 [Candidatus Paceibacterota bacterium]|nr:hypothetical protein [Candidatus Paceibacterota bacterium]
MQSPKWKQFQDYIASRLQCIDPNARSTKGSGNCGELGDVNNKYLLVECKDTDKKSVTFKKDVWDKLKGELPFHSTRIPMYAMQDKDGNKWAVVDLDDFLDIFIDHIYYDEGCGNE